MRYVLKALLVFIIFFAVYTGYTALVNYVGKVLADLLDLPVEGTRLVLGLILTLGSLSFVLYRMDRKD